MEPVVFDSYNILTREIASGLSTENIKTMKFIVRQFGKGILEKIVSGTDFLQLLEERDWLSAERVDQLSELLQTIGRHDLDNKVQMYADSAISRNLSNHNYYGIYCMQMNENYVETSMYKKIVDHLQCQNTVIIKGPPGTWKSQHAFRYAHYFSKEKGTDKSLIWRVDCNTDLNIFNSFSHLMNFLKIQCVNSKNRIKESIEVMLSRALDVLANDKYKESKHLFILLGFTCSSLPKETIQSLLQGIKAHTNIFVLATVSESLTSDFDNDVIEMHGMLEEEAIDFLNVPNITSIEQAKVLAKKLSYLPTGLLFARTYMQTTQISIESYLSNLETITNITTDDSSTKACQLLIQLAETKMSREEKKLLHYLPYINTDNIPVLLLKYLLPRFLVDDSKTVLINNFLKTLSNHSLISIKGVDDSRVVAAHSFTLMILKSFETKEKRTEYLNTLLDFFVSYLDLDARWLEVIHRNVLFLDHAEAFLSNVDIQFETQSKDIKAKLCYLYTAIGITYRLYGNTELSAAVYLSKAKNTVYKRILGSNSFQCNKTEHSFDTVEEYLNGSEALQEHCKDIFPKLQRNGRELSINFINNFVENKCRSSRSISLLCKYSDIGIDNVNNNQLSGLVVDHLRSKNLIMDAEHISETFLIELLIRILYNESKNTWLVEMSKDEFSAGKRTLMKRLSSAYFPVTPESLTQFQLAHILTQLLERHMESIHMTSTDSIGHEVKQVLVFCPVFSPVTHRSGIMYLARSIFDDDKFASLLDEAINLLDEIDKGIEGKGFTEFGVVKRIGDSSLFHSVMIDTLKMECYEKLAKAVQPKKEEFLQKAISIAKRLECQINDMASWKALSGIHLKIAKLFIRTQTEENIRKAKYHYRKAYDREFESNNTRFTRFHQRAVIHYAECCIQFPTSDDLKVAREILVDIKRRIGAESLFEEEIKKIDNSLQQLSMNKKPGSTIQIEDGTIKKEDKEVQTVFSQYDYQMRLLTELQHKRERLLSDKKRAQSDLQRIHLEIEEVEKELQKMNYISEK
ncbi:uncharacterized protein LOC127719777 [Mytilus californianus]|uniref:uncharacterized protein LOC127719777 n=1 Tax=Mytilus californianus TaxID=6549 RepID=UPI002245597B|nr:uncharacterized protein LOC127719777 [Mytilus californianus]